MMRSWIPRCVSLIKLLFFIVGGLTYTVGAPHASITYTIASDPTVNFVIIVPVHNQTTALDTLNSVVEQVYQNWHVFLVDDGSTDQVIKKQLDEFVLVHQQCENKITLVEEPTKLGVLHTVYKTGIPCTDNSVIVVLQPGQLFADGQTLYTLAQVYQDDSVWIASGRYKQKIGSPEVLGSNFPQSVFQHNGLRLHPEWNIGLPHTFRAWLLKRIPIGDLITNGIFYAAAEDAYMFPLLEMASKGHYRFVEKVLCFAETKRSSKTSHQQQKIRAKTPYRPLRRQPTPFVADQEQATIIVYSKDRPLQLYAFLESAYTHIQGNFEVIVIYAASHPSYGKGYTVVKKDFPRAVWHQQSSREDFKPLTLDALYRKRPGSDSLQAHYVLFAVDDIIVKDTINLNHALAWLELTGAHGFYLRLGKHITHCYSFLPAGAYTGTPPLLNIGPDVYAWQFGRGRGDWRQMCTMDMTLYRKNDIKEALESLNYANPNELESYWEQYNDFSLVGLCYGESKVVNIPLNLVQTYSKNRNMGLFTPAELLRKFEAGLKIDSNPLFRIKNESPHVDYKPSFIKR